MGVENQSSTLLPPRFKIDVKSDLVDERGRERQSVLDSYVERPVAGGGTTRRVKIQPGKWFRIRVQYSDAIFSPELWPWFERSVGGDEDEDEDELPRLTHHLCITVHQNLLDGPGCRVITTGHSISLDPRTDGDCDDDDDDEKQKEEKMRMKNIIKIVKPAPDLAPVSAPENAHGMQLLKASVFRTPHAPSSVLSPPPVAQCPTTPTTIATDVNGSHGENKEQEKDETKAGDWEEEYHHENQYDRYEMEEEPARLELTLHLELIAAMDTPFAHRLPMGWTSIVCEPPERFERRDDLGPCHDLSGTAMHPVEEGELEWDGWLECSTFEPAGHDHGDLNGGFNGEVNGDVKGGVNGGVNGDVGGGAVGAVGAVGEKSKSSIFTSSTST